MAARIKSAMKYAASRVEDNIAALREYHDRIAGEVRDKIKTAPKSPSLYKRRDARSMPALESDVRRDAEGPEPAASGVGSLQAQF